MYIKLTKITDLSTEANKDDVFTFEIEFSSPSGMAYGSDLYWYKENSSSEDTTEGEETDGEDSGTTETPGGQSG